MKSNHLLLLCIVVILGPVCVAIFGSSETTSKAADEREAMLMDKAAAICERQGRVLDTYQRTHGAEYRVTCKDKHEK